MDSKRRVWYIAAMRRMLGGVFLLISCLSYAGTCEIGGLDLNAPVSRYADLHDLFSMLSRYPETHAALAKIERGELRIKLVDELSLPDATRDAMAITFFEKDQTLVELKSGRLGMAAVALYHEFVHVNDADYHAELAAIRVAARKLTVDIARFPRGAEKDFAVLERRQADLKTVVAKTRVAAERKGYTEQVALTKAWMCENECAAKYFKENKIDTEIPSDETLRRWYGFTP